MNKIFFFSPSGYLPMKDDTLRNFANIHGWQADGETWVYGVAIPKGQYDPNDVADYLTTLGVIVLPGVHDHGTNVDGRTQAALAKFGITPGDKGIDVASKMYAVSGHKALKPHLF